MDYTDALAETICDRISAGESLRGICSDSDMPSESGVYGWLARMPDFAEKYARARKHWADAQIEEIIAVSRSTEMKADDKRVQIDTLKWAMGKLNGKYSDKLKHVGGDEDDAPIRYSAVEVTIIDPEA